MADSNPLGGCVSLVYFALSIAILVYTAKVFNYSSDNPFDIQLKPGENWTDFFNETSVSIKQCKCGEEILNDFCNEEQILSGCVDVTETELKNNTQFLRYLKMDKKKCNKYKEDIKNLTHDETLSEVFTLKFDTIHKMALGLLILVIIGFGIVVLLLITGCGSLCLGECGILCLVPFLPVIILFNVGAGVTNLILFIILSVNYFSGDTSTYVDFLDCKGVIKDKFNEKFKKVENLKDVFITFFVLNIIYLVLGCINNAANKKKDDSD